MFLFKSDKEKKAERLKELNYENTPEFGFKGKNFLAKVLDIYDGDTITITIKVDEEYCRINCRLSGIDSPELRSQDEAEKNAAKLSRSHLSFLLLNEKMKTDITREEIRKICGTLNSIVTIKCLEFDKYGRLLVEIWNNSININEKMVEDGFAGKYDGGTKGNWRDYFRHVQALTSESKE